MQCDIVLTSTEQVSVPLGGAGTGTDGKGPTAQAGATEEKSEEAPKA